MKGILSKNRWHVTLIVVIVLHLMLPATYGGIAKASVGTVIYVKQGAEGDGSSWDNALGDVHTALVHAQYGDEVWIAAGTYKPIGNIIDADPRSAHFQLKKGVAIYGGFPADAPLGMGLEGRNPQLHPTILTGDLAGNDHVEASDRYEDNAYHVFYLPAELDLGGTAILDGVTITGGNADRTDTLYHAVGGGIVNIRNSFVLRNTIITGNQARHAGGGIYNEAGAMELDSSTISSNRAGMGGGMFHSSAASGTGGVIHGHMKLKNMVVENNIADQLSGGGIATQSSMDIRETVIRGNTAYGRGGGLDSVSGQRSDTTKLTNVLISGNEVKEMDGSAFGGGLFLYSIDSFELTNVTITGNRASKSGGGMLLSGSGTFRNMIVWGNTGENGTASNVVVSGTSHQTSFADSIVGGGIINTNEGHFVGYINGTRMLDTDPLFRAPNTADMAPTPTGDYRLQYDSPAINKGKNDGFNPDTDVDLDGHKRIINSWIDMGAYEYGMDFTLLPDVSTITTHPVTIRVHVDDFSPLITTMEWVVGTYNTGNFPRNATRITDNAFQVVENGVYSVLIQGVGGYESVKNITIANITAATPPPVHPMAPVLVLQPNKVFTSMVYDPDQMLVGTFENIDSHGITGELIGVRVNESGIADASGVFTRLNGVLNGVVDGRVVEVELAQSRPSVYVRLIASPETDGQFEVQKITP